MNANTCEDVNNDLVKTKVTHDPGWNDPPVFSYDAVNATAQSKTPKRGLLLNKRVAFPLSSQPASNMPSTTSTVLPPIPSTSMSPAMIPSLPATAGHANTGNNITEENAEQGLKREDALQRLMEDFEQILKHSANDLQRNGTEIRRRLDIMKRMWEEDKLKPEICIKMTQLATALRNGMVR